MDERIEKRSLEDQATDRLRQMIVSGEVAASERLVETALASRFGLSRGTVRSALRRLVDEGLVQQVPYAGYRVVALSDHDLWEIFTLRAALEGLAARLAAERADADNVRALRAAFESLLAAARSGDATTTSARDHALHGEIVALSGHERLQRHYTRVANQFRLYVALSNSDQGCSAIGESHRELVEAICAGAPDRAERCARENILSPAAVAANQRRSPGNDSGSAQGAA
jgi:DNA-binding GntR family transcriptional regulator